MKFHKFVKNGIWSNVYFSPVHYLFIRPFLVVCWWEIKQICRKLKLTDQLHWPKNFFEAMNYALSPCQN